MLYREIAGYLVSYVEPSVRAHVVHRTISSNMPTNGIPLAIKYNCLLHSKAASYIKPTSNEQ